MLSYYKEECNMVILTKPKCLKHTEIPRVVKETKFRSVLKSLLPVRPVWPIPEQVRSTGLVRSLHRILERFSRHVWSLTKLVRRTIWSLKFELHRTCPALHRPCPGPKPNLSNQRVSFWKWLESLWSLHIGQTGMVDWLDQSALTAPTASFSRFL
jgi:hypothetical protein